MRQAGPLHPDRLGGDEAGVRLNVRQQGRASHASWRAALAGTRLGLKSRRSLKWLHRQDIPTMPEINLIDLNLVLADQPAFPPHSGNDPLDYRQRHA